MSAIVIFTPLSKSSSYLLDEIRGAGPAKRIEAPQNDADNPSATRFDYSDLYGESGEPQANDVRQRIAQGFQLAVLAAIVEREPDQVRNAIEFDQNRAAFLVSLSGENGARQTVEVTQQDVAERLRQSDTEVSADRSVRPLWPVVMESAYAKVAPVRQ